jgi:hypothetical protein
MKNEDTWILKMGIQGLLPLLQSITTDAHISEYENKVIAVGRKSFFLLSFFFLVLFFLSRPTDAFCWLHRSTYSCAMDLCLNRPTDK